MRDRTPRPNIAVLLAITFMLAGCASLTPGPGLVVFGGDCELTPTRMVVEPTGDEFALRLRPGDIRNPVAGVDYARLMLEPGDGLVTKTSLLARQTLDPFVPRHKWSDFPLDYPLFLCEAHSQLTNNRFFQNNLLHFLLSRDR